MNAHATAGALPPLDESAREAYARHARPRLMEVLGAVGLDLVYVRGLGDRLWYLDKRGGEVEVLDLVGGYGAGLLGHNHPALVERSRRLLDRGVPFLAQASARGYAGLLARRLSEAVGRSTGRSYVVTLASSGTEAVEAAIKHAELECAVRADAVLAGLRRAFQRVRSGLREHSVRVPEGLFPEAARLLDVPEVADLEDLFLRLFRRALDAMDREPVFLALEGSFHGKSTGALQLTHNPDYRSPWRRLGLRTVFLPRDEPEAAARAVANPRTRYLDLVVGGGGEVGLRERACTNITACFVEPVQGEGGIREVSVAMLRALRAAADEGGFPLVMDEIQCGMGRTGTFLASEPSGVRGDYYLLSKSLGGGLAKISALLVESGRYLADYGYLHTSTFAEDDPSSALALAVLELLEEGGGSLLG
ncbi:MAG: aminotransferase class III-fold pyridoxal phosphate-dependent enzyme, partial [Planctomycetes bacterium]|nr:aminotransferase class III-fold pyridoxal phosphate-dependent enzyme [Planctomycetota bacterium]